MSLKVLVVQGSSSYQVSTLSRPLRLQVCSALFSLGPQPRHFRMRRSVPDTFLHEAITYPSPQKCQISPRDQEDAGDTPVEGARSTETAGTYLT